MEEKYTLPDCNLKCQNGGLCKLGDGGDDDTLIYFLGSGNDDEDLEGLMYCECPEGYHGAYCEVGSVECGDNRCFHGSTCVENQMNGKPDWHCDCNTAGDKYTRYAGQFCQYESTQICTDGDSMAGHLFCVNDGKCQSDPYMGCDCLPGFRGFACEFNVGNQTSGSTLTQEEVLPGLDAFNSSLCALDCGGHGTCRKGIKNNTNLGDAALAEHLNATHSEDFEHCVCMDGFVGLQCEHKLEECDGDDHFCLHGSTCVKKNDHYVCDCSTANSTVGIFFAGEHCEHASTTLCTEEGTDPVEGAFCTNHGLCLDMILDGET